MNRRDDPNPFDEEDVNPFANGAGSKSRLPPLASEPLGYGNRHDATVDIPLDTMNDSKKKARDLATWEADLKRREKDIKRREDALTSAGVPTEEKNWPPVFPIIHHDISKEIPIHAQRLQYLAFASWLGMIPSPTLPLPPEKKGYTFTEGNSASYFALHGILLLSLCAGLEEEVDFLLQCTIKLTSSCICMLLVLRKSHCHQIHIGFCILAAIAPPIVFHGRSLTGILAAIDTFRDHALVGIFYLIGFGLFCLETLLSLWVLQKVYLFFRGHK
ncbi:hypothetical protein Taro_039493 [Colocasia esculenta]|uniref:Secretory carrier-associated membrane protein n=1 Tax=Colocasia esculenta TaxID=4460 RepID=A0A843WRP7_COLES|nr:hypothetical protein [Colocasia esculenta]